MMLSSCAGLTRASTSCFKLLRPRKTWMAGTSPAMTNSNGLEPRMPYEDLKEKMIWAGKVLVGEGQDDFTRGHVSVRLPDNPALFLMKAHSIGLDEITMDNILTVDLDAKVVAGNARRHSEVFIHSEIFKARADVACVLHTHPPYSIALSASGRPMKALSQPG